MKWTHWILLILVVATFSSLASVNAQESTLEPKPVPTLDATYTSDNGRIAISYPKNWAQTVYKDATTEPGLNIRISNNADTLKYFGALNKTFSSGDVIITITVYERYWLGVADKGLDATLDILTLRKTLEERSPQTYADETGLTSVTINNRPAVQADFKMTYDVDGYDLLIDLGDGLLAQIYAYAPHGELQAWDAVVQAIATSITYKPYTKADLTETYTSKDGKVSVNYPKGWETAPGFNIGLLSEVIEGENIAFGVMVAKPETEGVTFQSIVDAIAENLQEAPFLNKSSFVSLNTTINSHPTQLMAIPYNDASLVRVMLLMDLGDGANASIDGTVDKTQFERWQHIALVIAETITYTP